MQYTLSRLSVQRLQWLIGCALLLQSTDSLQTITRCFLGETHISPPGAMLAVYLFNVFAFAFRLTAGYLFLFRTPGVFARIATFLFLGLRAVVKMWLVPMSFLRWHEGPHIESPAAEAVDGFIAAAVACGVLALIVLPKATRTESAGT
jgi:hypothetical protein